MRSLLPVLALSSGCVILRDGCGQNSGVPGLGDMDGLRSWGGV